MSNTKSQNDFADERRQKRVNKRFYLYKNSRKYKQMYSDKTDQ